MRAQEFIHQGPVSTTVPGREPFSIRNKKRPGMLLLRDKVLSAYTHPSRNCWVLLPLRTTPELSTIEL